VFASYLIRIQCDKIENSLFIHRALRSNSYKEYIKNALSGSAQPNANAQVLTNMDIVKPEPTVLSNFRKTIEDLIRKIRTNQIQNNTLSQLRDELLPKLMSGKIRVKGKE
jgi:type I restriction enzyme S subunit